MAVRYCSKGDVFLDSSGNSRDRGKLNFFITGTSTPKLTYSDDALTSSNGSIVTLNSSGRSAVDIFLAAADYKVTLTNSDGTDSITDDPVHGGLTSAFQAYLMTTSTNLTGAGATVTVPFDTEVYDLGSDFASNTFTARKTGYHHFDVSVEATDLTAAMTGHTLNLLIAGTSAHTFRYSIDFTPIAGGTWQYPISTDAFMTAGDTAHVTLTISSGAGNTADILGGATLVTYFSGRLIA